MADKYLSFKFGDKHLNDSTWNGFISREDLNIDIPSAPEFDDQYSDSEFGSTNYFLGTNISQRTFQFHIVLNPITLDNYRKFLGWLSIDKVGDLVLDFNTNWKYIVKVSSIEESSIIPVAGETDKYIIELDVSFTTVYDWAAIYDGSDSTSINLMLANDHAMYGYFLNEDYVIEKTNNIITVRNPFNLPMYLVFNFEFGEETGVNVVEIKNNNVSFYKIENSELLKFSIYTKYGFILDSADNFIKSTINKGVLKIEPNTSNTLNLNISNTYNLINATMQVIIRERF